MRFARFTTFWFAISSGLGLVICLVLLTITVNSMYKLAYAAEDEAIAELRALHPGLAKAASLYREQRELLYKQYLGRTRGENDRLNELRNEIRHSEITLSWSDFDRYEDARRKTIREARGAASKKTRYVSLNQERHSLEIAIRILKQIGIASTALWLFLQLPIIGRFVASNYRKTMVWSVSRLLKYGKVVSKSTTTANKAAHKAAKAAKAANKAAQDHVGGIITDAKKQE